MSVCCECCVFSGRGLCDEPIPRPGESYRLWCVSQCDQKKFQTSTLKRETGVGRRGRLKKKIERSRNPISGLPDTRPWTVPFQRSPLVTHVVTVMHSKSVQILCVNVSLFPDKLTTTPSILQSASLSDTPQSHIQPQPFNWPLYLSAHLMSLTFGVFP